MCGQNPKVTKHFTDIKFFSGDDTSVTDFTSRGNLKSYKSLKKWDETHFPSPLLPASSPRHPLVATSTEGMELKGSATEPLLSFSPLIHPCCSPQPDKALRAPEGNACNIISCNWTPLKERKLFFKATALNDGTELTRHLQRSLHPFLWCSKGSTQPCRRMMWAWPAT